MTPTNDQASDHKFISIDDPPQTRQQNNRGRNGRPWQQLAGRDRGLHCTNGTVILLMVISAAFATILTIFAAPSLTRAICGQ